MVVLDYIQPAARPTVIHIIITIVHRTNMHMESISEMSAKGKIYYFKHIFFVADKHTHFIHKCSKLIIVAAVGLESCRNRVYFVYAVISIYSRSV